jgi:Asp-tRNA(Asn)/Glu-tRNA(Gln) amidotransferase A subunit family amidase
MNSTSPIADLDLRRATLCQLLHWLASGRVQARALSEVYLRAIERINPQLNAYVDLRSSLLQDQAHMADRRRRDGVDRTTRRHSAGAEGQLRCGRLADARRFARKARASGARRACRAAAARIRRRAGRQTNMDEGALGAVTDNPHFGATHNPHRHGYTAGGSSGGAAAAVAAGLAVAAVGSDSLGSIRIPASYCGVYALKPTHGEISARGLVPAARRLDSVGLLARSVDDLTVLLQVLTGYDADDARSRRRRVAFALPDWEPGNLRVGLLPDLAAVGVQPEVIAVFEAAMAKLPHALGDRRTVDFDDWDFARTRRAGLLLMEAEMLGTFASDLADTEYPVSARFREMLGYASRKSAADYAAADRVLDAATLKMRRLFAQVDVLVLPTTSQGAFPLDGPVPDSQADLTSFASLAGCPAVSLPMGTLPNGLPIGLQLVGARGSDLRLLELASVCAATLDAEPAYPVIA